MARRKMGSVKLFTDVLITSADLATADVMGVLTVDKGGNGTGSYTNGQLLIGNTTGNTLAKGTLTAGSGITITNAAGSITVTSTATGASGAGNFTLPIAATTASAWNVLTLDAESTGVPADTFGGSLILQANTGNTPVTPATLVARIAWLWDTAAFATRKGGLTFFTSDAAGERTNLDLGTTGSAPTIGVLGATKSARLVSPDVGTALVTFGFASGTPNFAAANLTDATGRMLPPGVIMDYASASVPTGWLACDGAAVSRTTFAALFTAIGTTWGVGNGSTTFNVPDTRGRVLIGSGTGSGLTARTLAATGGEETHQLTTAELASHSHTVNVANAATNASNNFVAGGINAPTSTAASSTTGSDTAHNNMQPFVVFNKIIKT